MLTVPVPVDAASRATVRVGRSSNLAVTVLSPVPASMVSLHGLVAPLSQLLQPTKKEPTAAFAVRTTAAPTV